MYQTAFVATGAGLCRLPLDGGSREVIWTGANISTPDANGGRVYFGQSPYSSYPGCLGRANPDGTDASCLEQGDNGFGR